jgi:hypothetical protein
MYLLNKYFTVIRVLVLSSDHLLLPLRTDDMSVSVKCVIRLVKCVIPYVNFKQRIAVIAWFQSQYGSDVLSKFQK